MRIGIDGYNLAMAQGTGVATYGATLAAVLGKAGHQIEGVFGLDPRRKPIDREVLFFDRYGHGNGLTGRTLNGRVARSVVFNHLPRKLREVPLTERVDKRSFGFRLPDFKAIWTSPLLFEIAYARFYALNQFVTISMPNPPEVMHWTYPVPVRMKGARNVYTIHDLVPLKLPQTTLDNKVYYRRLITSCIRSSDHIATVSEASRNDILSLFDVAPDKVTNTYQSSQIPPEILAGSPEDDGAIVQSMFGLPPKGFYLFFGALDPKKNIGRIVDAYLTSKSKRPLVIVSARDWGMDDETRMLGPKGRVYGRKMGRRVIQLKYLPRPTLFRLIRAARAVLFPSLYEGFGLPALEALQVGTPVISSTLSSLPEVVGDAGMLVYPYSTPEISEAIRAIDSDDALCERLSAAGLEQARKFTDDLFIERLSAMYAKMGVS
jgi:glycosyltransferase involved in cell wall biosynthesis